MPVAAPEPWVLRLKEYEFYQHYDEMAEYFWRLFFVFTANCLCGREDENVRLAAPFADQGWIGQFIDCGARPQATSRGISSQGNSLEYSWT